MLIPRRVKHRKQHHPGRSGQATGGTKVTFGEWGIQALTPATSKRTRPGFTFATHHSGEPFPEPIRVSAGFLVSGRSG